MSSEQTHIVDTTGGSRYVVHTPERAKQFLEQQEPREKFAMLPGPAEKLMQQLGESVRVIKQCKASANLLVQRYPKNPPRVIFTEIERVEQQLRHLRTLLNEWNFETKCQYAAIGVVMTKTPNPALEELRKRVEAMGQPISTLDEEFEMKIPDEFNNDFSS